MAWRLQDALGEVSGPFTEYDVVIKIHRQEAGASWFVREGDMEAWRPLSTHPAFLEALYRVDAQDRERAASAERLRNPGRTASAPSPHMSGIPATRGWQNSPWIVGLSAMAIVAFLSIRACNNWWDGLGADYRAQEAQRKADMERYDATARADRAAKDQAERERKAALAASKAAEAAREAARTPAERAGIATTDLGTGAEHTREGFCRGKKQLELIPETARTDPVVVKAIALYYKREAQEMVEARKEAEQNRGIVCADGSGSGCMCHGSHRGCCSHHGGIAGCTPLGDVTISCPK